LNFRMDAAIPVQRRESDKVADASPARMQVDLFRPEVAQ
jgi:hypothetical protein